MISEVIPLFFGYIFGQGQTICLAFMPVFISAFSTSPTDSSLFHLLISDSQVLYSSLFLSFWLFFLSFSFYNLYVLYMERAKEDCV